MKCTYCGHLFKMSSFAYKSRQRCPKCSKVYQIFYPSGCGFIPIIIACIPALYMVFQLKFSFMVGLSIFIVFYWPIDIIMNLLLIIFNKYKIKGME